MTPPEIRLRRAGSGDARAVGDLHATSWRSAYRGILSDSYLDGAMTEERRRAWAERLSAAIDPRHVVVVAEAPAGGAPLAFACILYGEDPHWGSLIDNLHVRPDVRRLRLGRAVLAEAARLAPAAYAETPLHLTVFEANARAIAAYESWGGRLAERLDHVENDGRTHALRRYAWENPSALIDLLN